MPFSDEDVREVQRMLINNRADLAASQTSIFRKAVTPDPADLNRGQIVMGVDVGSKDGDSSVVTLVAQRMNKAMGELRDRIFTWPIEPGNLHWSTTPGDAEQWPEFPTYGGIARNFSTYVNGGIPVAVSTARPDSPPVCVLTAEEQAATKPSMDIPRLTPQTAQSSVDELTADIAVKAERLLGYRLLRKEAKLENPLLGVLRDLDIQPFDQKAVDAYKEQAVLYRRAELKRALMERPEFKTMSQSGVYLATSVSWDREELSDYEREVPVFVLAQAVSIAERLPAARFYVEELHDDPFLVVEYDDKEFAVCVWAEPGFEVNL